MTRARTHLVIYYDEQAASLSDVISWACMLGKCGVKPDFNLFELTDESAWENEFKGVEH